MRERERPAGAARPKRVAIVQSSYIPWKGYFDIIRRVDEFVLFDEVQFTRRDWRNRNRIKTPQGPTWLTIPVASKGNYRSAIEDIRVGDDGWREKHWASLRHAYARAPCFPDVSPRVEALYAAATDERLSDVNVRFLRGICDMLGIDTPITWSRDYPGEGRKSGRLASICAQAGASEYLSGPSARAYLDEDVFTEAGVEVRWMDYEGYPEYEQLHPPFEHHVSVLDLLFHVGSDALDHMLPPAAP